MKYERVIRMKEEVELLKHEYKHFNYEALKRLCEKFGEDDTTYFLKVAEVALPYNDNEYDNVYDAIMAGENDIILIMPATSRLIDEKWVVPYYDAKEEKHRLPYLPIQLEEYALGKKRGMWQGNYNKVVCANYLEAREKYKELHERFLDLNF